MYCCATGLPPVVIARGGFSGLFPDSSQFSYQFALSSSLPDVVLYCDLQLSSDGMGFCKTGLTLENSTLIAEVFPKRDKTYKVNGEDVHGWFSLDFTSEELYQNVTCKQKKNLSILKLESEKLRTLFVLHDEVSNCKVSKAINIHNFLPYLE